MRDRHVIGAALRATRERKGLTRPQLTRLSGVSISYQKLIEQQGQQPSDVKAWALANALGVHIDAFTTHLVREQDAA